MGSFVRRIRRNRSVTRRCYRAWGDKAGSQLLPANAGQFHRNYRGDRTSSRLSIRHLWRRFDEVVRFERPTIAQIETLMKKRLKLVSNRDLSMKSYVEQMAGSTFGDVERVCLDVLKVCALDGRTQLQNHDIAIAVQRQKLRNQVMRESVASESPRIDTP